MFSNQKKLAQQTAQSMIAGHFSLVTWWILKHAGVLDAMLKLETDSNEGLVPLVHAARTNMDPAVLEALIDYQAKAGLLTLQDNQARLTPEAKALLQHEDPILEIIHSWEPVLHFAEHMLARLKIGAAPAQRKTEHLAESRARRHHEELFPAILALLNKHHLSHILDLSCGHGDLLMYLAANSKNIVGVGIAMDGPAVRRANHAITAAALEKRLIAVAANPLEVCTDTQRTFDRIGISRQLWDEIDCIIAPSVFSDMATRESSASSSTGGGGDEPAARALAAIPHRFPRAHLLIIEPVDSPRFEKNYYAPELALLLRLAKSTPGAEDRWRTQIQNAKLKLLHESPLNTDALTLFLCRP